MNTNQIDFPEPGRRELAAGMLKQAARDLRRYHGARSTTGRELYTDAYDWVTADEFSWPFSFLNVCGALNLAPETVRDELMSDVSLGTFRYWTRRLGRAARRSRLSLTEFFARESGFEATDEALSQPVPRIAV